MAAAAKTKTDPRIRDTDIFTNFIELSSSSYKLGSQRRRSGLKCRVLLGGQAACGNVGG